MKRKHFHGELRMHQLTTVDLTSGSAPINGSTVHKATRGYARGRIDEGIPMEAL